MPSKLMNPRHVIGGFGGARVVVWMILLAALVAGRGGAGEKAPQVSGFSVVSRNLTLELTAGGTVKAAFLGPEKRKCDLQGLTRLAGCRVQGPVRTKGLAGGGVRFEKTLVREADGRTFTLEESFLPARDGVRWSFEILDPGTPWSTAIETRLFYPAGPGTRFWTPWADPRQGRFAGRSRAVDVADGLLPAVDPGGGWADPLVPLPFTNALLHYGAPPFSYDTPRVGYAPFDRDVFCMPMAAVLEQNEGTGLSIFLSPEDLLLDLTLETTREGGLIFTRIFHRLGEGRRVAFSLDLAVHEADWRAALRWITRRYPSFFDPPVAEARFIAGTGAYSSYGTDFDVEKIRDMAFKVNWRASFDFPYMGMFLPPVDEDQPWTRYGGGRVTLREMGDYSRRMRALGFHVLNYFNVTEFGAGIRYPPPPSKGLSGVDLWKDANGFLYVRLKDAILFVPKGPADPGVDGKGKSISKRPFITWGGAVAMDPGEPVFRAFLLEQARRHVQELPESSGICIDRMDWLRMYNHDRDDGVSWFGGQPVRALWVSWRELMKRLTPIFHDAGKVVFVNNHVKRLDLLRHVDGFFDEFTYGGCPLNTTALLGIRKPVLGWTANANQLRPDPDAFFQKYLYLGVFPMAPFPLNDHALRPGPWVDRQYLDYGPLLSALCGKRWVLEPGVIEAQGARANLFEVPGGFVVPVVFAGRNAVTVVLQGLKQIAGYARFTAEAIHPGGGRWTAVPSANEEDRLVLRVPVERGCAMVRLGRVSILGNVRFIRAATVELSAAEEGARLFYTLDGSVPDRGDLPYDGPFELTESAVVTARAFRDEEPVGMLRRRFHKVPLPPPEILPGGGTFVDVREVRLIPPDVPGAAIRYTLDGGDPTELSERYAHPIRLVKTTTVRARAFLRGVPPSSAVTALFHRCPPEPPPPVVHLPDLQPEKASVGWGGAAKKDRSIQGKGLSVAGRRYEKGMGVHAVSDLVYALKPEYETFVATAGVDDEMKGYGEASVIFRVFIDDRLAAESPVIHSNGFWHFLVPLPKGAKIIRLHVGDGEDGISCDHADWVDAGFRLRRP